MAKRTPGEGHVRRNILCAVIAGASMLAPDGMALAQKGCEQPPQAFSVRFFDRLESLQHPIDASEFVQLFSEEFRRGTDVVQLRSAMQTIRRRHGLDGGERSTGDRLLREPDVSKAALGRVADGALVTVALAVIGTRGSRSQTAVLTCSHSAWRVVRFTYEPMMR